MTRRAFRILCFILVGLYAAVPVAHAGNKRIMSIAAAKVLAERALIESIYGLKVRATEEVADMVAASFVGTTESKTKAMIKGVRFEEVVYDPQKDLAKVTASVQLPSITNIDGVEMNLGNKVFRRVAFATATPSMAGPIKALRAAELDAYKQLVKRIVGFQLESQSSVENYILTSDTVKTKVLATLYMAELEEYGWNEFGDAYVKMSLNVQDIGAIIGEPIIGEDAVVTVEGQGAQEEDLPVATKK